MRAMLPVDPATLAAFTAASLVLLVIPGPTILMVIGQALAHGRSVALASVLGVGLGDLIAASLSIAGVGTLLAASALLFEIVKLAGAAWLIWLGLGMWRAGGLARPEDLVPRPGAFGRPFRDAFLVTLFNPKGIIFFMAFVPQFIAPAHDFAPQAALLVAVFVVLGIVNAWGYAMLAGTLRGLIRRASVQRWSLRACGSLLIGAGVAALFARRTT